MRIFTSFHHDLNEGHADEIIRIVKALGHTDISVNDANKVQNEESLTSEAIRRRIRDGYLRDVDVTILIAGSDIKNRKHLDWEVRSTVHKFENERDGAIVVINALNDEFSWVLSDELQTSYDGYPHRTWGGTIPDFNCLPQRLKNSIVDNIDIESSKRGIHKHAVFPIVGYKKVIENPIILQHAINQAIKYKVANRGKWDLQTTMKRSNDERSDRPYYQQVPA